MKPIFNRVPLTPCKRAALPLGSIHPEGWLLDQLRTQADGYTGPLHEQWADVGESCAWLGGDGDGWERAPYYLDGLVSLAWGLDDEKLKALAMKYIEWMLASQREDGWFGPCKSEDGWFGAAGDGDCWPLMIALKALRQYFTATGDERVPVLMDRFFRYQYENLDKHPLESTAVTRCGDNIEVVLWLYNLTGQEYLLGLCKKLHAQTLDWTRFFHDFPYTAPLSRSLEWPRLQKLMREEREGGQRLEGENRPYYQSQFHLTHGVNVAMGLKTPGVVSLFKSGSEEHSGFMTGWQKLLKHHGVASGVYTCDEHFSGPNPTQGTETCTIVELMYTLETLLSIGDFGSELPDILEKLAYNALPAAFTPDMSGHQYDQQVNQVKCSNEPRKWYNNGNDSNVFGFSPFYGCCTANGHQGWPKFTASLWYATDDGGLSAVSYAPCTVRAELGGTSVQLRVSGGYPFARTVTIEVSADQPAEFPLHLRVPFWAQQPMIHLPGGEVMEIRAGETACVRRKWKTGDTITLELPAEPRLTRWHHQSGAVELGPLLMAFRPGEIWTQQENGDWNVSTEDAWNWALLCGEQMQAVYGEERTAAFGKGGCGAKVLVRAVPVDWTMDGGSAADVPVAPRSDAVPTTLELVPFGDTGLRIAQFPVTGEVTT